MAAPVRPSRARAIWMTLVSVGKLRATSSRTQPVADMKSHPTTRNATEGSQPPGAVRTGSPSIPAPMQHPATSRMLPSKRLREEIVWVIMAAYSNKLL